MSRLQLSGALLCWMAVSGCEPPLVGDLDLDGSHRAGAPSLIENGVFNDRLLPAPAW